MYFYENMNSLYLVFEDGIYSLYCMYYELQDCFYVIDFL
jgi:hypothetical protein